MPNWSDLLNEFRKLPNDDEKSTWLSNRLDQQLAEIGDRRDQKCHRLCIGIPVRGCRPEALLGATELKALTHPHADR